MKTINHYFVTLFLVIAMPLSSAIAQNAYTSAENAVIVTAASAMEETTSRQQVSINRDAHNNALAHLNFIYAIPAKWESQIVREDYENQSIFSMKVSNASPVFLFSVTQITTDQWMKVKNQLNEYTIIENKDGFITFVQKTDEKKIKGMDNGQSQEVLRDVDETIVCIRMK